MVHAESGHKVEPGQAGTMAGKGNENGDGTFLSKETYPHELPVN
jgi:hypothetical protein